MQPPKPAPAWRAPITPGAVLTAVIIASIAGAPISYRRLAPSNELAQRRLMDDRSQWRHFPAQAGSLFLVVCHLVFCVGAPGADPAKTAV
jgi:hypothetical protein